ncbi:putative 30S ribosomal protein S17-like protein [Fusarium oxysporum f. sp. rapae]|uniref:Putative 30S ribosomal protein S17-like protein n=1 Tax=Fusarium oxysporum f. sp. rapae TaxID=485398 RepID=A0A8J5P310_FUSOX|nr:putative 30S ribosomal protein S17-like protein [Fusarium oxysporum f. sp. rapae]
MECLKLSPESVASLHGMSEAELRAFTGMGNSSESDSEEDLKTRIYASYLLFEMSNSDNALEEAILWTKRGIVASAPDKQALNEWLDILATLLVILHHSQQLAERIAEASSRDAMLNDIDFRMRLLKNQAARSMMRFEQSHLMEDLNVAIAIVEHLIPMIDLHKSSRLQNNLGIMLHKRYQRTEAIKDLSRAIDAMKTAISLTPGDSPDLADRLNNLGLWLSTRFGRTDMVEDLDYAVEAAKKAVKLTPESHQHYAGYLNNLANSHGKRFQRTSTVEDIDCAIEASSRAVESTSRKHTDLLNSLGVWLYARFETSGELMDLDHSIEAARRAVDITSPSHPDRSAFLNTLGTSLSRKFERTDSVKDLNEALDIFTQCLGATPRDEPNFASTLNNLGICHGMRFERAGSIADLDLAIGRTYESVSSLANKLSLRFERTSGVYHLDRAIELIDEIIQGPPLSRDSLAAYYNDLGSSLRTRYEKVGRKGDIVRAIEASNKAVDLTAQDHPDISSYLNTLSNVFGSRFHRTDSLDDLDCCIENITEAVKAMPQDHPDRSVMINNLGNRLDKRFRATKAVGDRDSQIYWFLEAWNSKAAAPSQRIRTAGSAAYVYIQREEWEKASTLLREALLLLPKVSPRFISHTDKQNLLSSLSGLTSMAASAALSANKGPYEALRLLELGIGLISGFVMDIRTDVSELKLEYPVLAKEFDRLRDEMGQLQSGIDVSKKEGDLATWQRKQERFRKANEEFDVLLGEVRGKSGFETFLLPPTEAELMAAATPDPIVVINVSFYRCDAFIIDSTGIRTIDLPDLSQSKLRAWASFPSARSELASRLEWLWYALCHPCLGALGLTYPVLDDNWPHTWWIPTDALSCIPIHAAGRYGQGSTETVMDRTMSSYALTIKSLLHGRKRDLISAHKPERNSALLVAMRNTPGSGKLPYAEDEVNMVKQMCPKLDLKPGTPRPLKEGVLISLDTCNVFHFAGHGRLNPAEPSKSCLCLEDWETNPLTVQDIRGKNLESKQPFLAYLSACSTRTNMESRLSDEGIHLVGAFYLTGFRHVIGTLWEVSDKHCVDVAEAFYETLRDEGMTDLSVCRGLHRALRKLRDKGRAKSKYIRDITAVSEEEDQPDLGNTNWMPYVHFGC